MGFKAVLAKVKFSTDSINRELLDGMDRYTKLVLKEFDETVQTWSNKPAFTRTVATRGKKIEGEVSTKNKIYGFVSGGTVAHTIFPRRAKRLAWQLFYTPKTTVGKIPSKAGGPSGAMQFSRGHRVSGITARKFDKQIKDDTEERFYKYMYRALESALLEV